MPNQKVICPNCHTEISIDDVLTHQIEASLRHEMDAKHLAELKSVKITAAEMARKDAIKTVHQEYLVKIEATKADAEAREKQNKELREQLTELLKQNREMRTKDETREIEFQKRLTSEQDAIKQRAKAEAENEMSLTIAQEKKKNEDAQKQISELQRKLQQGSQQSQGEVQELILEDLLLAEFPADTILEVPKGIDGADVIQEVKNRSGIRCGTIVWESKNTKAWTHGWIAKLKNDQRSLKAELAVIVTKTLPDTIKGFGIVDGVWVCDLASAIGIASALRQQLVEIHSAKAVSQNMNSKAEIVYGYLTSNTFKQRIEVWVEYFKQRNEEIAKEKIYFTKKWAKEEQSIQLVFGNTAGIYGDLQGLIGNALPKVHYFELPDDVDATNENNDFGF